MSATRPQAVVAGAGVIGLLSSLSLLQRGYAVTLLDQQQPGKGASWAGGGILTPLYPWKYPAAVNALARYGQSGYRWLNQQLYPYTGIDIEIETCGLLILDPDQQQAALAYAAQAQDAEQQAELLTGAALQQRNPRLHPDIEQAVWFSQIAHVRNPRLIRSLLAYLRQQPHFSVQAQRRVCSWRTDQDRVTAVIDQHGQCYAADQVILATGAWSALLEPLGQHQSLAIRPILGQMLVVQTPPGWLPTLCMQQTRYAIPRRDGLVVCGSSTEDKGFATGVTPDIQQDIHASVLDMLPGLGDFEVVHAWSGLRPGSAQGIPYISQVPGVQNLWINAGHYRNGLVMAPASVQLLMALMHDEPPLVNPAPYRLS